MTVSELLEKLRELPPTYVVTVPLYNITDPRSVVARSIVIDERTGKNTVEIV